MLWRSVEYGWVEAAWLIPCALLIAIAYIFLDAYRRKKLASFADKQLLQVVVSGRSSVLFWTKVILLCIAWVCAVAALMQPRGNPRLAGVAKEVEKKPSAKTETQRRHDIAFLIDVSASMGVNDNGQGDASRLGVAKEITDHVISQLKGENVALTAFTSQSLPIVPITTDYLFTRLMLRSLDVNEGETAGTDILKGLEGVSLLFAKTPDAVAKTFIILTDGDDTSLQGELGKKHKEAIMSSIQLLKDKSVKVIAVGLGSLQGNKVPGIVYKEKPVVSAQQAALLQEMASSNGYYNGDEESPLEVAKEIGKDISIRTVVREEKNVSSTVPEGVILEYDYYYKYPLAIALAALALFLGIPDTWRRKRDVVDNH